MIYPIVCLLLASVARQCVAETIFKEYLNERNAFLEEASKMSINEAWELTKEEQIVDERLAQLKETDLLLDPVPVQFNFVTMQSTIDNSKLFKLLQSFPKGALLHSHDLSTIDMHYYVNASYLPGCLYSVSAESYGDVSFIPGDGFVPINDVRSVYALGVAAFDQDLYKNFTLTAWEDEPDTTGDELWDKFQPIFGRVRMMYLYLPVFRNFYYLMFSKLLNDGIIRWEIRTDVTGIYDNDKEYTPSESVQIIVDELEAWKAEDYEARKVFSFGIIFQGMRDGTPEEVTNTLVLSYQLRELYPDVILGFDLVGHEDPGQTLLYWAPILLNVEDTIMKTTNVTTKMPFFFHAGESNRLNVQENLVDAVFLNSTRIGHGFGIQEFPLLWPFLSANGIMIEACPISNQVLGLVVDQRNHPVGQMLKHALHNLSGRRERRISPKLAELLDYDSRLVSVVENMIVTPALTVSISNDDPGFWDIDAVVSYDWYIAVLSWDLSLGGIKQLAIDSIVYSEASVTTRAAMLRSWSNAWDTWVAAVAAL
jgi:adenosine deaminase CECR1